MLDGSMAGALGKPWTCSRCGSDHAIATFSPCMNSKIFRASAAVIILGGVWGFGYFIGADRTPGAASRAGGKASGTPLAEAAAGETAVKLSSTAIGRVIEGKSDFRRQ